MKPESTDQDELPPTLAYATPEKRVATRWFEWLPWAVCLFLSTCLLVFSSLLILAKFGGD